MTAATPFNWLTALESAIKHEPSLERSLYLVKMAGDWPTCACSDLCVGLPRHENGSPKDYRLFCLGTKFYNCVFFRAWHEALATFHAIEARTAELLAEKAKQSP